MSFMHRLKFWKSSSPLVSMVRLQGIISSSSLSRKGLNLDNLESVLKKAFSMSGVKAVALIINSPGGSPVQSELIGAHIRRLSKTHNVPVLAFCEDVAASGGYWLAASADEIYASEASIIGSIGVISAGFGFPDALTRLGIERRVYTSGKSKSMLDPFQPEKPDDVTYLKSVQSTIHEHFIEFVKQRRGSKLTAQSSVTGEGASAPKTDGVSDDAGGMIFSGRFWTGSKALELGLIDGIGTHHSILESRFGKDVRIVTVHQKRAFFPFGSTLAEAFIDNVSDRFFARNLWQRFGL